MQAQDLWFRILESQAETGTPYILFKDSCNKKSNQKNLGTIKSSNLCCEIVEHTSDDETAVCNLASLALPSFVIKPSVSQTIKITTIPNCQYCYLAKAWCERWELNYEAMELPAPEVGMKYPQIEVDDFKGGFTDFVEKYPVNYDYEELAIVTKQLTRNLNRVIDRSTYPIESARRSNMRHRPIGLGVQGLADVFMKMRIAFDSEKAKFINDKIFETIYFAALTESNVLATKKVEKKKNIDPNIKYPGAYSSFEGSPLQNGEFQFDMWGVQPSLAEPAYDWNSLRDDIQKSGVVNSLLVAPMPTASTAQILGNNECFEPITSNIYVRRTLAGEFIVMNKYLQEDLENLGIWNTTTKNSILANSGSVQHLNIPDIIKNTYKTVWEISQRVIIDLAAERGKFICQSQSLNLFFTEAKQEKITSALFYAWKKGLKTGCYYLRTRPQTKSQQFTVEPVSQPVCEACSG
jgi:ribonucleoside-diphosphate reductase subunit M1